MIEVGAEQAGRTVERERYYTTALTYDGGAGSW